MEIIDTSKLDINGLLRKEKLFSIINSFAETLLKTESIPEIFHAITNTVISKLDYEDCVIYLYNKEENILLQHTAYGFNSESGIDEKRPFSIKPGEGIVGSVFLKKKGEIIKNTKVDERYLEDEFPGCSEITIPIILENEVVGIIDSEHSKVNFYKRVDYEILTTVANLASIKIGKISVNEDYKNRLEIAVKEKTMALEDLNSELVEQNAEKEILIKEIHHRVKNNMQIIISLLNMQINSSDSPKEKQVFKECADRMHAIANIHGNLYFENNVLRIPVYDFLYELGSFLIVSHYKSHNVEFKLNIEVEDVRLDIGIPIGLIVNELISCSLRSGFNESEKSKINVRMKKVGKDIVLNYRDNSTGYDIEFEKNNTFSDELIEILVEQLDGELIIVNNDRRDMILTLPIN